MKRNLLLIITICGIICRPIYATVTDLDVEIGTEITSAYVWRGMIINDEACIQPSINIRASGFSLNVWGTWDLTDITNSSQHTRMDTTLDYTYINRKQIISTGIAAYLYKDRPIDQKKDTFEVFFDYTLDVLLLPSFTVYYDFGKIEGFYASFALAHSFDLYKDTIALDLGVSVGGADNKYTEFNFPVNKGGKDFETFDPGSISLVDLTSTISMPISVNKNFTIIPGIKYMTLLDSKIKDVVKASGEDKDNLSYSLAVSLYF